jgi:hypothetical protein
MGGDIIRQDQHGRLAIADEIARHSKNEVGVVAVHLGECEGSKKDIKRIYGQPAG